MPNSGKGNPSWGFRLLTSSRTSNGSTGTELITADAAASKCDSISDVCQRLNGTVAAH